MVWQVRGLSLLNLGQKGDGLSCLENAVRLAPNDIEIAANAVESFRQAGDNKKAVQIGQRAMSIPAKTPTFLGNLGIAVFEDGNLDEAKSLHHMALQLAPDHLASLNNLGSHSKSK